MSKRSKSGKGNAHNTSGDNSNYRIGYGRPPREYQFRKGQSGNPKGRPRRSIDIAENIMKRFLRVVTVRENGIARRITAPEALFAKGLSEALQGKIRPFTDVLKLFQQIGLLNIEHLNERVDRSRPSRVTVKLIKSPFKEGLRLQEEPDVTEQDSDSTSPPSRNGISKRQS